MKLAACVVVYNKNCKDSTTCQCLSNLQDQVQVIICDNSTSDFHNKKYCEDCNWIYLGGAGNVGLSKAYNQCINYLSSIEFDGYLCLFYDDTQITGEYFEYLQQAITQNPADVYVPLIYSAEKLLSPCRVDQNFQVKRFSSDREALNYNGNDTSAINSCMAIKFNILKTYRYDENIFLDGIDHKFIKDMHAMGKKLCVFPYTCVQQFSSELLPPKQSALNRFQIYVKDTRYIFKNSPNVFYKLVFRRASKLAFPYKTVSFFVKIISVARNK